MSNPQEKIFLLRGTPYRILIRGATVVLEYGGKEFPALDPDTMMDICIAGYYAAKKVKERYRLGPTTHGMADLTDANTDELEEQSAKDGTAAFSARG